MPLLTCSDITYDVECEENKRFYYYYLLLKNQPIKLLNRIGTTGSFFRILPVVSLECYWYSFFRKLPVVSL